MDSKNWLTRTRLYGKGLLIHLGIGEKTPRIFRSKLKFIQREWCMNEGQNLKHDMHDILVQDE